MYLTIFSPGTAHASNHILSQNCTLSQLEFLLPPISSAHRRQFRNLHENSFLSLTNEISALFFPQSLKWHKFTFLE